MTLVYAKIIDMFVCGGQTQVVGGRGWGGTWKFPKLSPTHRWLSVGGGRCGGGAMMGVGRVVGKGWGEALIEVLEQNRYCYFRLGCWNARRNEIGTKLGGFPRFKGIPIVMTS